MDKETLGRPTDARSRRGTVTSNPPEAKHLQFTIPWVAVQGVARLSCGEPGLR